MNPPLTLMTDGLLAHPINCFQHRSSSQICFNNHASLEVCHVWHCSVSQRVQWAHTTPMTILERLIPSPSWPLGSRFMYLVAKVYCRPEMTPSWEKRVFPRCSYFVPHLYNPWAIKPQKIVAVWFANEPVFLCTALANSIKWHQLQKHWNISKTDQADPRAVAAWRWLYIFVYAFNLLNKFVQVVC